MSPPGRDRRVAFFGGSFDPPHLGHLAVARAARAALELDTVLFAPVGAQPLKPNGSGASFEDRVAMVKLAIADEPGFAVSLADAPRPGGAPNYTLETLVELRKELKECELYCLMGADSLAGMQRWHRAAEIPFVAALIVASRPGQPLDELRGLLPQGLTLVPVSEAEMRKVNVESSKIPVRCYWVKNEACERAPFYLLPGLDVQISASQIRELARAQGQPGEGGLTAGEELLPEAVSEYARSHGLYR
jgi:nicotinate-nucleotide adenylyltransferase